MHSEPLADLIARLLGPAPGRRGGDSGRSWWRCPFHPDKNPSLCVEHDGETYHCFGCGAHGDAIDFVRRLNPAMSFGEAKARVEGVGTPTKAATPHREPSPRPPAWQEFARRIVAEAEAALWSGAGGSARAYLNGRGLDDATIRAARLGLHREDSHVEGLYPDHPVWVPRGIVIPWLDGDEITMVNIRRPPGSDPKYWAVRGSRRDGIYPSARVIRVGNPLAIVEGELESLSLGRRLDGLAAVVTLGSAGDRPRPRTLARMLAAPVWYAAGDSDGAGEASARGWLARSGRCRRVRPPAPHKDWTEVHQAGIDLRSWWREALARETLLMRLQARGNRLDGTLVHPRIAVGTVTGRVVYTNPGLQTLPEADRLARLAPVVDGRTYVRADFAQIEPRILLKILRDRGLIAWDAGIDLYRTLSGPAADRDAVKVAVNRVINGGRPPAEASDRLAEFIRAADAYRAGLASEARAVGFVRTLAGRAIPLAAGEDNHGGKAVNRVVQGTAADIFNRAVSRVDAAIAASGMSAAVAFLLFDELWVEAEPAVVPRVAALVRAEMEAAAAAAADGVAVPVRIEPAPPPSSWGALSALRWGPSLDHDLPGIVVEIADRGRMQRGLRAAAGHAPPPSRVGEALGRVMDSVATSTQEGPCSTS